MCRHFGILCLFHLHRSCEKEGPVNKTDGTVCSEKSVRKIETPGNHPKERINKLLLMSVSTFIESLTTYVGC